MIDNPTTEWPGLLRRMISEGHQIGSHGWGHENLETATSEVREKQIIYNEMAIRNVIGMFPKYFRPPYGSCTVRSGCLSDLTRWGYKVVNWEWDTRDIFNNDPEEIQYSKDIFASAFPEPYVAIDKSGRPTLPTRLFLAHDTQYQTAYNLTEYMIRLVQNKGYKLVTVADCLGDDPNDWYYDARDQSECYHPTQEFGEKSERFAS
jgi:peptidoglycan/xylan/chitin deacetylase (PgdA/CDA1 family)